jgi:hypothetical protein
VADYGDTSYERHTYISDGQGGIKDIIEIKPPNNPNDPYVYWSTNLYKIKAGTDSTYVYIDFSNNQTLWIFKKGTIAKTIDKYSPYGPLEGRIYILEFTKP